MQFVRKYGAAFKIRIPVVKAASSDFAVGADWTPAAGDVKISKDGGGAANITTLPVAIAMGNGAIWEFAVSATEAQAAEITITVVDSATKAVQDQALSVITFGNASAGLQIDWSDAVRMGLTALPNANAGANGGLPLGDASGRVDIGKLLGTAWLTPGTAGTPDVNVKLWGSGAVPATNVAGVPLVDVKYILGTISPAAAGSVRADAVTGAVGSVTGAVGSVAGDVGGNVVGSVASVTAGVTVTTNNDKAGYSLTQTFPANFSSLGISVGGHISNVDTLMTYTGNTPQTGDSYARIGAAGAGLTALGDTRIANLDATVSSRLATTGYTLPDNVSIATILNDVNAGAGAIYTRLGAPAGASIAADLAAVKSDSGGIKTKTDSLTFTVAGVLDSNVLDWKGATAPAMTGDAFARLGAPAGASVSADVAAVKSDSGGIKTKTDGLTFTIAGVVDSNVLDWKSATAPAMTGDAFARLGAPAGASVSADVAAVKSDTGAIKLSTDNLPSDPADESLIIAATNAVQAAIAALPTTSTVNAIKSRTDLIPNAPSAVSDIPTAIENADTLLDRDMAAGVDTGSNTKRTVRQPLRWLRNKWLVEAGLLSVYGEDDVTVSWNAAVSTDAAAVPVVGADPTGP